MELEEDARAAIVCGFFPAITDRTTRALAYRYSNPLVLETICQLPRYKVWRDNSGQEFDMSSREISELPELLEDVYREFWNQLPKSARKWLAMAWVVIPKHISREEGASEDTWIHSLLHDVVTQLSLITENEIACTVARDPQIQGWVRVIDTDLRSFAEPEMAHIVGQDGSRLLRSHLVDAINAILVALARALMTNHYYKSNTEARTVLALNAEGYMGDIHAIEAINTLLSLLQRAPREINERVRLYKRFTTLDKTGTPHNRRFSIHRLGAFAIGDSGQSNQATTICRTLLNEQTQIFGVAHPDVLQTRNNLATFLGEAGAG